MTPRIHNVLKAAADLPPDDARRVVSALADHIGGTEDDAPADGMHALRAALAEDMQPLGEALWMAAQAGDIEAMRAALKKISRRLPDFVSGGKLAEAIGREYAAALTGNE